MILENGNWYEGEGWDSALVFTGRGRLRKGILFRADGTRYHGGFLSNSTHELLRYGWGTLYNSDGTVRLIGWWINDKMIPKNSNLGRKTGVGSGKHRFVPGMGGIWDERAIPGRSFQTGPGYE